MIVSMGDARSNFCRINCQICTVVADGALPVLSFDF